MHGSPAKVNGKHQVRVLIHEITGYPPVEIKISIQTPSSPVINDLFARMPPDKCSYNHGLKMWILSFSLYDKIVAEFHTPPFSSFHLDELPNFLTNGLSKFLRRLPKVAVGSDSSLQVDPALLAVMMPFQVESLRFVINHGGRALLADDMGCGKTLQAISALMHYRSHWPALIIVPCSLLKQWPDEIKKYTRLQDADICCISKSSDVFSGSASVCITTYTIIGSLVGNKALTPEQFGVVIADESHNIKNKDAHRSIAVLPFLRKAQVALCMTGTPAVNRPVELFPQLAALLPEVFCEYLPFVHRYCDAKPTKFGTGLDVSGHSNDAELKILLTGLVMIRRTKSEVLQDLPEKVRELRHVEPDPKYVPEISRINDRSKRIDDKMKEALGQGEAAELQTLQNEKQTLLNQLYQVTGMSKIHAIKQELLALIEGARQSRQQEADSSSREEITVDLTRGDDDGDDAVPSRPSKRGSLLLTSGCCKVMELEEDIVNEGHTPVVRRSKPLSRLSYSSRFMEDDDDSCGVDSGLDEEEHERGTDMTSIRSSSSSKEKKTSFIDLMLAGADGAKKRISSRGSSKAAASAARKKAKQCPAPLVPAAPRSRLGHKIIAFFHHQVVMEALEAALREMEVQFIRIDGSTSQKHRSAMIAQFQDDNLTYVALLSLTACGTGLNLTRANVAVFAELNWSLGTMLQAEDRIHRMGQLAKDVRIIYMIARDTVDETVWNAIQKKHQVVGATVGTSEGNESHRGTMKVDCGHRLQRPLASLPSSLSSSSSSSSSSSGRKVLDEAPVQPCTAPTASHQVPIYEFYRRCSDGPGSAPAAAGLQAAPASIDPLHRPHHAASTSCSPHHCSTATDLSAADDGSFNAAASDCAFVYSVPISLSGEEPGIPIACTAISSHLGQPVNASRANDGYAVQPMNTSRANDGYAVQPMNASRANDGYAVQPVNTSRANDGYAVQPVNASRANDGYAVQPVNASRANDGYAVQPVNASRANDGYAVQPVNTSGANDGYAVQPVNASRANDGYAVQPVNTSRANDGYAVKPMTVSVTCEELLGDLPVSGRMLGSSSVPKAGLGPDVMARIAANRSAALAKLAAKNNRHAHANPSRDPLSLLPHNTALPPAPHVFSTGKGSAVVVSHEKIVEGSHKLS